MRKIIILNPASRGIYVYQNNATTNQRVRIYKNKISLAASSGTRTGINMVNSSRAEIFCNGISASQLTPASASMKLRGIDMVQCAGARVHSNETLMLGTGIRGQGNQLSSRFECNGSDKNYYGFYFSSPIVLSDQGTPNSPSDNQWVDYPGSGAYRASGNISYSPHKKWHYRGIGGSQYDPQIDGINPLKYYYDEVSNSSPPAISCFNYTTGQIGLLANCISKSEINLIATDSVVYPALSSSFKYFNQQFVYRTIKDKGCCEDITSSDTAILVLYDSLLISNIPLFDSIPVLLDSALLDSAIAVLMQIAPSGSLDSLAKFTNYIYLTFVLSEKEIPAACLKVLERISFFTPFKNGDAVYISRAILGTYEKAEDYIFSNCPE